MSAPNTRIFERIVDNDWHVCQMLELNKGDLFRLCDPIGWGVKSFNPSSWGSNDGLVGGQTQLALSDPHITYENEKLIWGIIVKGENNNE